MIEVHNLTKYYGTAKAVNDLSFRINKGEIVGFLGLNGAGKTTILKILTGLLTPSAGTVTINGMDLLEKNREIRSQIGYLPDVPPLYSNMETSKFLQFVGQINGVHKKELKTQMDYVVEETGIKDVLHKIVGHLSHGYRQRLGIAQALIHNPPILIFDEPIHGLDPAQIVEMRSTIKRLGGKHTILLSSHILHEISQTCDRIFVIHNGQMMIEGSEEELSSKIEAKHVIELEVRGNKDDIINSISSIDEVEKINYVDTYSNNVNLFKLFSKTQHDIREDVAKTVINNGFGLLKLNSIDMELEAIFMRLIQTKEEYDAS